MANKRVYDEVEGCKINGISIGGLTSIITRQDFVHATDSEADGHDFPSDTDEAGQQVTATIVTTDVLQLIPLLLSTPGSSEWFGHESGAATYGKGTLANLVCHSGRFESALGSYARITVEGQCRFGAAADTFEDVEGWLAAQTVPTITHPVRYWQPGSAVHGELTALHVQSIGFNIGGRLMTDYDAGDKGTTAVDVAGYNAVGVDLTVRDASQQTGPPTHDLATALMLNEVHNLVVGFTGVGEAVAKTLTLRNCRFRNKQKTGGRDWTGHALSGVLRGRDPTDPYTVRTIDDATPADRLINFS